MRMLAVRGGIIEGRFCSDGTSNTNQIFPCTTMPPNRSSHGIVTLNILKLFAVLTFLIQTIQNASCQFSNSCRAGNFYISNVIGLPRFCQLLKMGSFRLAQGHVEMTGEQSAFDFPLIGKYKYIPSFRSS